ncbi:MAG: hypothetical protein RSD95_10075 [Clostridia bacterium]
MARYSKSFERDENRLLNKGLVHSALGLLLGWVPVVSIFLALSGFLRAVVRVTELHRVKRFFVSLFAALVLTAVIGAHIAAVYFYVQDPGILDATMLRVWTAVTGQESLPWKAPAVPEDDFANYGTDPYAQSSMAGEAEGDFNDDELSAFEEDLSATEDLVDPSVNAALDAGATEDLVDPSVNAALDAGATAAPDLAEKDLFNQMMDEKQAIGGAVKAVG